MKRGLLATAVSLPILLVGCDDSLGPNPSPSGPARIEPNSALVVGSASIDLLAKGLAIALADADFRQRTLEDLRDSPFPYHSLQFRSYLSGDRGRSIMAVLAAARWDHAGAFANALPTAGNVALRLNPSEARTTWTGSADL